MEDIVPVGGLRHLTSKCLSHAFILGIPRQDAIRHLFQRFALSLWKGNAVTAVTTDAAVTSFTAVTGITAVTEVTAITGITAVW